MRAVRAAVVALTALGWLSCARSAGGEFGRAHELFAKDPTFSAFFGWAIAADGEFLVVGAPNHDAAGAAYFFERAGSGWRSMGSATSALDGADDDELGNVVAIDGDLAIVGAHQHDATGKDSGAAYVFARHGSSWQQSAKLTPGDAQPDERYGYAVGLDGHRAVVGLVYDPDNLSREPPNSAMFPGSLGQGTVYVHELRGERWIETARLTPGRLKGVQDGFGQVVAISGDTVVAGASGENTANGQDAGAVYVFEANGREWRQSALLAPDDAQPGDRFGACVAIDGDLLAVGAPEGANPVGAGILNEPAGFADGAVYVFQRRGDDWSLSQRIEPSAPQAYDDFGCPLAIAGDLLAVGAPARDWEVRNQGAVFVYRQQDGRYVERSVLKQTASDTTQEFGAALTAIDGAVLGGVARAYKDGVQAVGAVYTFSD